MNPLVPEPDSLYITKMSGPFQQQTSNGNKATFDPGWNDPPPVSYSPQVQTSKPRVLLNKRVAFPLSPLQSSAPLPGTQPPILPPMPPPVSRPLFQPEIPIVLPQPLGPSKAQENELTTFDSESALKDVTEILYSILEESSELESKVGDIRKRLDVMENMWRSGQLNITVQHIMRQLATALQAGRAEEADELHKALMVEHVAQVGAWMPAVRRLLHHCAARDELLAIDQEES